MFKIALLGCGRISKKHAELIGNNLIENTELVAVCDNNTDKAQKLGKKYNVPYYNNMDNMLKNCDIDIVSVLTPSGMHFKHISELFKYKVNIIVEKPLTLRFEEAEALLRKAREKNIRIFTVKQNRYNLPVKQLRIAVENNKFGKIFLGTVRVRWCRTQDYYNMDKWRGTWKYDGGVLANQAIHHIDLLQWFMGDAESVYAKSLQALSKIEAEDTAVATIRFKSGALGIVEATTATRPKDIEGSLSILGEKGSVEISGFAVNQLIHWEFEEADIDKKKFSENPPNVYGYGHKAFYEDVIDSLINNKKALTEGEEAVKSIKLMNAMYESIETGREVFMENFDLSEARIGK